MQIKVLRIFLLPAWGKTSRLLLKKTLLTLISTTSKMSWIARGVHQVDPPENANFHTVSQKTYVF